MHTWRGCRIDGHRWPLGRKSGRTFGLDFFGGGCMHASISFSSSLDQNLQSLVVSLVAAVFRVAHVVFSSGVTGQPTHFGLSFFSSLLTACTCLGLSVSPSKGSLGLANTLVLNLYNAILS